MFVESAFAFITLFNTKGRTGYQHVALIWANQCDLNITKNIHKRWLNAKFTVKASHISNYILHFKTLRRLPDLQQGFSPTTKNSRKNAKSCSYWTGCAVKIWFESMHICGSMSLCGVVKYFCVGQLLQYLSQGQVRCRKYRWKKTLNRSFL